MSQAPPAKLTYAEYLLLERREDAKHEYLDGVVRAMAGGTPEHGRLAMQLGHRVRTARGDLPCVVLSSDVRVRIEATSRSTYPDLSIVCGRLERSTVDEDAIVNPVVIVEVLSDRTEAYDRGEKFRHYRRIESLREYVLVSQSTP